MAHVLPAESAIARQASAFVQARHVQRNPVAVQRKAGQERKVELEVLAVVVWPVPLVMVHSVGWARTTQPQQRTIQMTMMVFQVLLIIQVPMLAEAAVAAWTRNPMW